MTESKHKKSQSQMEQAFVSSSTLKRNRRYFDVEKVNQFQQQFSVKRRKPISACKSVNDKISSSFMNSTAVLTDRLDGDIQKFKSRVNNSGEQFDFTNRPTTAISHFQKAKTERSVSSSKRGVPIEKQLSRQKYYSTRNKPILDERLFMNFSMEKPDEVHAFDLTKGMERDLDYTNKNLNELSYQTQKLYQQYYYKKTTNSCKFNYKKQKKEPRKFFNTKRPQNKPATELSPKAVKHSFDFVRPRPNKAQPFYCNSGKKMPCQLDNRFNNSLTNFWVDENGKVKRTKLEYGLRKMKDDLQNQRIEKIKSSKKVKFNKGEVCDRKYFVLNG